MRDGVDGPSNIDEPTFNKIIDGVMAFYVPIAKAHGANLTVEKRWTDTTVNAFADQAGNNWTIHMFGGLARRPEITPDGFALVVCHELGHHFGGYAFYPGRMAWAAAEGEADYFSTQACAKAVWGHSIEKNARFRSHVESTSKEACDATYANPNERDLCYRSADAGLSLATLLGTLSGTPVPHIETPDPSVVKSTFVDHPQAQCRLDTYFEGALCTKGFDPTVIPGKGPQGGMNNPDAEVAARNSTCMMRDNPKAGFRPLCWFKPLI